MAFTPQQAREMQDRLNRNRKSAPTPEEPPAEGVTDELKLHSDIIDFCNAQWPRWKYIHANPVKKSTIGKGVCDFTLFLPQARFICIECKSQTGKISPDQRDWIKEMRMLEIEVHLVRSMEEFHNALRKAQISDMAKLSFNDSKMLQSEE